MDLSVLVLSCDKYSALWPLFFSNFRAFWPDCRYPVYLLSNHKAFDDDYVSSIRVGDDIDWSTNLLSALAQIPTQYVLLMIDDAPLTNHVTSGHLEKILSVLSHIDLNYLNLKASPRPLKSSLSPDIGILPSGTLYRASLVPCIWKKSTLQQLLVKGENAWEFEINGSIRSDVYDNFLSLSAPFFEYLHIVVKGMILRSAVDYLISDRRLGELDFPIMSMTDTMLFRFHVLKQRVFARLVPNRYHRRVRIAATKLLDVIGANLGKS
jgi:hypothetical protein